MINIEEIRKNPEEQDWNKLSQEEGWTEELVKEFEKYFKLNDYWVNLFLRVKFSEEFLIDRIENKGFSLLRVIFKTQTLSEEFIRRYPKEDWEYIWMYQEVSESFIEEFWDKVDEGSVSVFQKLSKEFIIKHFNQLDIIDLFANKKIPLEDIPVEGDLNTKLRECIFELHPYLNPPY